MPTIRAAFDHYREVYHRAKPTGTKPHIGLMREIYVGETDQQAREIAEPHWRYFWERRGGERTYGGHGQGVKTALNGGRMQELLNLDQSLEDGSFICGSPDTVTRQILEIAHQAGADTFLGEFTFGALEHKQALDSLNRFIKCVLPALKVEAIDALNSPKGEVDV